MRTRREPVDPYVQEFIAGTNGNLYVPLINRLTRYPIPRWPRHLKATGRRLLLDLGCGWGRWSVAAGCAGHIPVGVDVKLEAAQAARRVMAAHGIKGHVVVADIAALPFREDVFDAVFSYSVVQHLHRRRAAACIHEVARVLKAGSACLIELPLKHGLTNVRHLWRATTDEDDPASWAVRYYGWGELQRLFASVFGNVSVTCDCFCGIGVRPEDMALIPWRYKPIVVASMFLKGMTALCPPFVRLSDSVFARSTKSGVA